MGGKSVTREELLQEAAEYFGKTVFQRPGPEWFTFEELYEVLTTTNPGITKENLRTQLKRAVKTGAYLEESNGVNMAYYKKA